MLRRQLAGGLALSLAVTAAATIPAQGSSINQSRGSFSSGTAGAAQAQVASIQADIGETRAQLARNERRIDHLKAKLATAQVNKDTDKIESVNEELAALIRQRKQLIRRLAKLETELEAARDRLPASLK